jgi:hypothetical protein
MINYISSEPMKPLAPIGLNTHPLLVAVGGERASLKTLRATASGASRPLRRVPANVF